MSEANSNYDRTETDLRSVLFDELQDRLETNDLSGWRLGAMSATQRLVKIERIAGEVISDRCGALPTGERRELVEYLVSTTTGYGPLDRLMTDPRITDVLVVGTLVRFEREGELKTVRGAFASLAHVRLVLERMLSSAGRTVDYATPIVDASLPEGGRLNVTIPPVSREPVMSIRLKRGQHATG